MPLAGSLAILVRRSIGWTLAIVLLLGSQASAIELFDGRAQIHGFYEMQFRVLNSNYGENWDVSQWYNVFDVEVELDLIQDTIGPIDLMSAYIRLEARYDCIYSRGCGMFRSMNAYGDRSENLPRRLSNATKHVTAGTIEFDDDVEEGERYSQEYRRNPVPLSKLPGIGALAEVAVGGDTYLGLAEDNPDCISDYSKNICKFFAGGEYAPPGLVLDDTFAFATKAFDDYRFTSTNLRNNSYLLMGPWLPKNKIYPNASMAINPNPFDDSIIAYETDFSTPKPQREFDPDRIRQPLLFSVAYNGQLRSLLEDDNNKRIKVLSSFDEWVELVDRSIDTRSLTQATGYVDNARGPNAERYVDARWGDAGFMASPPVPAAGCPGGIAGGVPGADTCTVRSNSFWRNPDFEGNTFDDPDNWENFTGHGGNWVTLFINHKSKVFYSFLPGTNGPDPSRFINQSAEFVSPGSGSRSWSPYTTGAIPGFSGTKVVAFYDLGALDFAESTAYGGALPMRPIAELAAGGELGDEPTKAQGGYYPSPGLVKELDSGRFDEHPFNISESDRAWNRGDSQRQTKELKEAYLDIEMLDSRLWLRLGKQTIVWGKTELFSFSDQFNPQDLALASLPSLEESRIALWSARAVYSLYSVGPLDDVRFELALNYDENQPADLGACGEAYTVDQVCQLTFGLFVHGVTGLGVAGIDRPPDPWHGLKGWEVGGRTEFRWDRFSVAISDFYGYDDFPTLERMSNFERNVDSRTGLARTYASRADCLGIMYSPKDAAYDGNAYPGGVSVDSNSGCLTPGPQKTPDASNPFSMGTLVDTTLTNALYNHPANLQVFATACYATTGIAASFDPGACGLNVFNSQRDVASIFHLSNIIGGFFAGTENAANIFGGRFPKKAPFVRLSVDYGLEWLELESETGLWTGKRGDLTNRLWDQSNRAWAPAYWKPRSNPDFARGDPLYVEDANPWSPAEFWLHDEESNCHDDRWAKGVQLDGEARNFAYVTGREFSFGGLKADRLAKNPYQPNDRVGNNINPTRYQPNVDYIYENPDITFLGAPQDNGIYRPNCGEDAQIYLTFHLSKIGWLREEFQLSGRLTPEQEALLGCGPFWGTNCDVSGVDFLNADVSVLVQSWPGIDGTESLPLQPDDERDTSGMWRTDDARLPQPGTVNFRTWASDDEPLGEWVDGDGKLRKQVLGAPRCTTNKLDDNRNAQPGQAAYVLPGCRGLLGKPTQGPEIWAKLNARGQQYTSRSNGGNDYFHNPTFFGFHPFVEFEKLGDDPNGNPARYSDYPLAQCRPGMRPSFFLRCFKNTFDPVNDLTWEDKPGYHNRWEPGYDVRRDGNPLGVASFYAANSVDSVNHFPEFYCRYEPNRNPSGDEFSNPDGFQYRGLCAADAPVLPNDATPLIERQETWGFAGNRSLVAGGSQRCTKAATAGSPTVRTFSDSYNFKNCWVPNSYFRREVVLPDGSTDFPDEDKWYFYSMVEEGLDIEPTFTDAAAAVNLKPVQGRTGESFPCHRALSLGTIDQLGNRSQCYSSAAALPRGPGEFLGDPQTGDIGKHPFTGQQWQNELAALSWNLLMFTTAGDDDFDIDKAYEPGLCSYVTPQYCDNIRGLLGLASLQHRRIEAGGNGTYGRREMVWHAGGEVLLKYTKRNVMGIAVDFSEDRSKTNWSLDFTWIDKVPMFDAFSRSNVRMADQYNLTISVDRPTFINFLNPNHTFFINSQWFVSYLNGWKYGVQSNGPWNVLGTITALTGYFQDRLNAQGTLVYDFKSNSGGVLPQVNYRINQDFSVTFGAAVWFGRDQLTEANVNPIAPNVSPDYSATTIQSIHNISNRDELFMRIRYTF